MLQMYNDYIEIVLKVARNEKYKICMLDRLSVSALLIRVSANFHICATPMETVWKSLCFDSIMTWEALVTIHSCWRFLVTVVNLPLQLHLLRTSSWVTVSAVLCRVLAIWCFMHGFSRLYGLLLCPFSWEKIGAWAAAAASLSLISYLLIINLPW